MEIMNNQYHISLEIDEYMFDRYVADKVRGEFTNYKTYKDKFPEVKCHFILRNKTEDTSDGSILRLYCVEEKGYFARSN